MNKILFIYDDEEEIILITKSNITEILEIINLNLSEGFILVESIDGKIGLNPNRIKLIKDITQDKNFNPGKNLKLTFNIGTEKLAERIKNIIKTEMNINQVLGN